MAVDGCSWLCIAFVLMRRIGWERIPTSFGMRCAGLVGAVLPLVVFFVKNPVLPDTGGLCKRTFLTNIRFIVPEFDLGLYSRFFRNRSFPAL